MLAVLRRPVGYTPRSDCGLAGFERILARAGLGPVAGIDEAGRGACAGPLVVAAAVLRAGRSGAVTGIPGLADSKTLTALAREQAYEQIVRAAADWSVVVIPPGDIDRLGLHVCNISGMRRALAGLACRPGYVLTDGFAVHGLAVPALAMWKGDQVAACVAAASILAKVTRDRIMAGLHGDYPDYGFARHKGYSTPTHMKALAEHGPCPEHRRSFVNVGRGVPPLVLQPALQSVLPPVLPSGGGPEPAAPGLAGHDSAPEDGHNGPIVDVSIVDVSSERADLASLAPAARPGA